MSEQGDPPPNPPGPDPGVLDNMFQQFFMNMLQRAQQQPAQPGGGAAAPAAQQPRVPLPYPDEKNAPRFDGDEYKVGTFLDSFESRARLAGVAEGQWKKKIVDYCDRDTRNQWMQLDEFTDDSPWDEFRTAVLELYPENGKIKEYTLEELKDRIAKWKELGPFRTSEAVSTYTREFLACQKSLSRQGIVHQRQELYLSAFSKEERTKIERRLEWRHPDQHYRDLTIDDISKEVRFLAKNHNTETTDATTKYAYSPLASEQREVSAMVNPTVKKEQPDERLIASIAHLLEEKLDARLGARTAATTNDSTTATQGYSQSRYAAPRTALSMPFRPDEKCIFCDDPSHRMKQCPMRLEYIRIGKLTEDILGRTTLPGGLQIPGPRSVPMHKRVDDYWTAQQNANYFDQVMMIEYPNDVEALIHNEDDDLTPEEREYQAFLLMREHVLNYENTGRFQPKKRFDGVELPSRSWGPASNQNRAKTPGILPVPAAVRTPAPTPQEAPRPRSPEKQADLLVPIPLDEVARKHAEMTKKAADKMEEAGVQFRNRAPAADESMAERVFDRMLDTSITASLREMLAISGDTRRLVQKYTTTRRTPVSEVHLLDRANDEDGNSADFDDVFQVVDWEQRLPRTSSGDLAAHDSLPLMVINSTLAGEEIETIIDTGSTICCMSDRVWRKIGAPVYTEKSTNMRDANGNVAGTLGAVLDQLVVIGGLKFFVTIHVVPNAPFSLILGTPFCAIASIEISYRPSSEMVVKITDPNSEKTVLIPGSAKPRRTVAFARSVDSPKDF